jgi:hypothetical protein
VEAALARSNDRAPRGIDPQPAHYERVPLMTVADGWCRLTLGWSLQSLAGGGRLWTVEGTGHMGRCGALDVKDADVVCIPAIEKRESQPLGPCP